jgi:ABC-2 type transport system ATP-binding protein
VAVVTVDHLTKAYGRRPPALAEVSLEVQEGVTGLLGPNGAGKSTLIQCVLGLLRDYSGSATILGLDSRRDRLAIRRRVGYMPEADAYVPRMSAVSSCRYLGELSGLPRSEALRRAHECLHFAGLTGHLYKPAEDYSTGMRQRLKLAQALVHDPEIVFLDEPVSGLDPEGREELLDLVRQLARDHGKHVVWSSHMLPDVQRVADQVLVLVKGELRGSFRLDELRSDVGLFEVEVEGDVAAFERELAARGLAATAPEGVPTDGEARTRRVVRVPGEDAGTARLLAAGRAAGVRVRRAVPQVEKLEDVFHRLLDGGAPRTGGNR